MKKILIAVDMQNDFIDGSLGSPDAVSIVSKAAEKIKNFGGDVFATYDTHGENYMSTSEGRKLPVSHCIKGTHGWKLNEKIEKALDEKGCIAVEKPTFGSLDLPEIISDNYGETDISIELIGLCTDICVISNALILKAHFPEAEISVDSSCCAGTSPENHLSALSAMKSCQIDIK